MYHRFACYSSRIFPSTGFVLVLCTESDWLKWWNEVAIFQMTSTTTRAPQVTTEWNWNFTVVTVDQQTQSSGTSRKWNMFFTDFVTG